ncbi:hypothetical protein V2I01_31125 [Micromonospora sp. BRA006-A]|nr:hypothetical protein [Micromonospora sp. BRA006-A]
MVTDAHAAAMSRRGVSLLDREPAMAALRAGLDGDDTASPSPTSTGNASRRCSPPPGPGR